MARLARSRRRRITQDWSGSQILVAMRNACAGGLQRFLEALWVPGEVRRVGRSGGRARSPAIAQSPTAALWRSPQQPRVFRSAPAGERGT